MIVFRLWVNVAGRLKVDELQHIVVRITSWTKMKLKTVVFLVFLLVASIVIIVFSDPTNAAVRFVAKLNILIVVLTVPSSLLINYFFGRDANRQFWTKLVLFGVSLGVSLIVAEFGVRIVYKDVSTTGDNSSFFARRWHRQHPPAYNELGFRENEVSPVKSPGTYRIAIIGDSFTYGQGIFARQRFSDLLQDELSNSSGRYEVLNFGRSGNEIDDHLKALDDVVIDLDPDFVLIQWFVNDVEISHAGRVTDRMTEIRLIPSDFLRAWLHLHSALYYVTNSTWSSLQQTLGFTDSYVDNMTRRFENPDSAESRAASAAIHRLMRRLDDENIPTGIVLFPLLVDTNYGSQEYPLAFLMERVLAVCDERGIPCLDLRPIFATAESTSSLWANRLDHHPGALANEMAKDAIYARFAAYWTSK